MTSPASLGAKWIDKRLEQAFHLVDEVLSETHNESDAYNDLRTVRDLIENADWIIETETPT